MNNKKIVMVSGGFDPLHIGHLRLFKEAKKLGDTLIVIINNDDWVRKKKGYVFMPIVERAELIDAYSFVDAILITNHSPNKENDTVCRELDLIKPDIFANGGDRKPGNIPEYKLCRELGIEMVFNVGGGKIQSSSDMVNDVIEQLDGI